MQGILNKPLGKAIARRYTVTGSWDKPKIVQIARERPGIGKPDRQSATPQPGDGGPPAASEPPAQDDGGSPPARRGLR
jgi:hypothetical protein